MPLLAQQSMQIGQKYFMLLLPKIQGLAQEMAAELGGLQTGPDEPQK